MKKVLIIHGFQGSPNGGWRPWLMRELEKQDIYACALPMPNPGQPILSEWLEEISRQVDKNNQDEIYLVGHSLGVPAILHFLESYHGKNVKGIVLVSGPIEKIKNKSIEGFLQKKFDFQDIKTKVEKSVVIHGDNDPNVPLQHAEILSQELDSELIIIKNGGHLNGSSGFTELNECLQALNKIMK